jgi:hypothetical protein
MIAGAPMSFPVPLTTRPVVVRFSPAPCRFGGAGFQALPLEGPFFSLGRGD